MDEIRKRRAIRGLAAIGIVEMKPTGCWGLTLDGRDFLDQLEVLHELDDRPGAPGGTERSGAAAPSKGARPGDDDRTARGRRRQTTKGGRHT